MPYDIERFITLEEEEDTSPARPRLTVIVTGTEQLGEVTAIHAKPAPPPERKAEEEEVDEEHIDQPGELVRLADYDHHRSAIRLRNLRAA